LSQSRASLVVVFSGILRNGGSFGVVRGEWRPLVGRDTGREIKCLLCGLYGLIEELFVTWSSDHDFIIFRRLDY
jgi:hypothetical protein